jgi:acetyl-CoA C-acetyltransferase
MFAQQGHLGAMPATVNDGLWDTPATRHEAACASGSVAALAAMADLRAGNYRTALVVGLELEKTVPGDVAAQHLGAAAWTGHEGQDATYLWPYMFAQVADEYDRRFGIDDAHLHAIAAINLANARRNPNAQTREWRVPDLAEAGDDDDVNPPIEGRIRRFDCSQMTDGGAGVVLVSDEFLAEHPGVRPIGRIEGWGHRTVGLGLQQKLDRSRNQDAGNPYVLPHVRGAVHDAFHRAEVDLDRLDGFEVHDCFTPSEYLAIDHIGLTGPGESWKAIESGDIELGGRLPINPSGGLIGGGHPVGASGIRMMLDAAKQVSGLAGDYQVDGARRFGTLNIGGSTATTVSFVIGAAG